MTAFNPPLLENLVVPRFLMNHPANDARLKPVLERGGILREIKKNKPVETFRDRIYRQLFPLPPQLPGVQPHPQRQGIVEELVP